MRSCLEWKNIVIIFLIAILSQSLSAHSEPLKKGKLELAGISCDVWGTYNISQMLFPNEQWVFYVIVVPQDVRQGTLIEMAKVFYKKYPNTRARFFSDTQHIQQYIDRDIFVNDRSGFAKKVDFPDSTWVQNHHLANINNRSKEYRRAWMLENRYGSMIALLP